MKTISLSALGLAAVIILTGCQQTSQQRRTPQPAPAPVAKAESAPAPMANCSEADDGRVILTKEMPAEVALGTEFPYELNLKSRACVANVTVTDMVPAGASFVRSEPAARNEGGKLSWQFAEMDANQNQKITVWLKADREGTLASCATIHSVPRVCDSTLVGKPMLAITKTGPETALLGSEVAYTITVSNPGTFTARNVVVKDPVPEGYSLKSGQRELTFNVGDLEPKQSKTLTATFTADRRGRICNVASATATGIERVSAEACTLIVQPGLAVEKTGDEMQYLTRNARYQITVSNTGDTPLTKVVVTDTAPAQTKIVSASGATINGNTATWNIATLDKGAKRTFDVVLTSATPGRHCNSVAVTTAEGPKQSAEACTDWRGVSALLLEKADNPDPIQVGENTTYTVKVTNQGTADDTNIKMVVEFPAEIDPVSASNGGTVSGKRVTFPAYPRLAPKQAFEYTIVAKGVKVGDARVRFVRTSDGIPAPTSAEESTRVY